MCQRQLGVRIVGSKEGNKAKQIIEEESIATSIIAIAELADKFERLERLFDAQLNFIQSRATILPLSVPLVQRAAKLNPIDALRHE